MPALEADRGDRALHLTTVLERTAEVSGTSEQLPDHTRVVIIGGGVGGASIAYHLAKLGWTDVVLVERADLASGTTFHSAGNIGQLRATVTQTRMMQRDGVALFRRLQAETGIDPSWREVGSMRVASSPERAEELRRQAGTALALGLDVELLCPAEAIARFPIMSPQGIVAALFIPTDGWIDPAGLTIALAAGARALGTKIYPRTRVLDIGRNAAGRVTFVATDRGAIRTEHVVNAGGMFAPEIARLVGIDIPIVAVEHQYLLTEPLGGVEADWPVVRDPDNLVYFRPETGGLLVGGFERNPAPWGLHGIPADFNARLLAPDWVRFEEIMPGAMRRIPTVADAGITRMVNGPDAFTPDGEFILGESHVPGFWLAAGFCSHGIALAPAIGQQMAHWIADGTPEFDLAPMDVRRFGPQYRSRRLVLDRTMEVAAGYFSLHAPGDERQAGRPLRRSAAYPRLAGLRASFGERAGWERANWFDVNHPAGVEHLRPPGLAGRNWSPAIAAEAIATRTSAGLFDMSSFTKTVVRGPGALGLLQALCANQMDRPVGSIVYTQLLNERGGIQCDVTVTRVEDDRFLVVSGTAAGVHDLRWIRDAARATVGATIEEITSGHVCYGLWGPNARTILASVTDDDLSAEAFPYLHAREIAVGAVPVLALRVTNVGELGWELYAPAEYGLSLWDTLWEAGEPQDLVAAGYRAADALRLEKGYRAWPADVSPEDSPLEAGLGFAVKLDKGVRFMGQQALTMQSSNGVSRRLRCLVMGAGVVPIIGSEPVILDGRVIGRVRSGGYGYTTGCSIAYAYLPQPEGAIGAEVTIDVLGEPVAATVVREPLHDPSGSRIRA